MKASSRAARLRLPLRLPDEVLSARTRLRARRRSTARRRRRCGRARARARARGPPQSRCRGPRGGGSRWPSARAPRRRRAPRARPSSSGSSGSGSSRLEGRSARGSRRNEWPSRRRRGAGRGRAATGSAASGSSCASATNTRRGTSRPCWSSQVSEHGRRSPLTAKARASSHAPHRGVQGAALGDAALRQHQAAPRRERAGGMQRRPFPPAVEGSAQRLAVHRDLRRGFVVPAVGHERPPRPGEKAPLEPARVDQHQHPPQRVVRGDAARQLQEPSQPSPLRAAVQRDVLEALGVGQHRAHRDRPHVHQPVLRFGGLAGVDCLPRPPNTPATRAASRPPSRCARRS